MEEYIIYRIDDEWKVYVDSVTGDPAFTKDRETILREIRGKHGLREIRIVKCVTWASLIG